MQCHVKVMQCHAVSYSFVTVAPDRQFGTAVMEHTLVTSPLRGGGECWGDTTVCLLSPFTLLSAGHDLVSLTNDSNEQCLPTTCP